MTIYLQDREVDLFLPIRPGSDPSFDSLLESVGSVSKHCPKLMIDSIMVWRKSKSESTSGEGTRNMYVKELRNTAADGGGIEV